MNEKEQLEGQLRDAKKRLRDAKLSIDSGEKVLEPTDPPQRNALKSSMDTLGDRVRSIEAEIAKIEAQISDDLD